MGNEAVTNELPETVNDISITKRKKTMMEKAKDAFVVEDISAVWEETKSNVLLPGFKRLLESAFHAIISGIFSGDVNNNYVTSSKNYREGNLISYDEYWKRNTTTKKERNDYRGREKVRKDISSYAFASREDAEMTLEWMDKCIRTSRDGYLTVAEWYDHFHIKAEWTDNDFGWRSISGSKVMPNMDGGFYLLLPRPESIR